MKKVSSKFATCFAVASLTMVAAAGCTDKPQAASEPAPSAAPPAEIEGSQRALTYDSGFLSPTAISGDSYGAGNYGGSNQWTTPRGAFADDTTYATDNVDGDRETYFAFGPSPSTLVPANATIVGFEVALLMSHSDTAM